MRFCGVHPSMVDPIAAGVRIATFVLTDGRHRFVAFKADDLVHFHALAPADTPGALAAYLIHGPGEDAYRARYGV